MKCTCEKTLDTVKFLTFSAFCERTNKTIEKVSSFLLQTFYKVENITVGKNNLKKRKKPTCSLFVDYD